MSRQTAAISLETAHTCFGLLLALGPRIFSVS
jgi:hypothetical protein